MPISNIQLETPKENINVSTKLELPQTEIIQVDAQTVPSQTKPKLHDDILWLTGC